MHPAQPDVPAGGRGSGSVQQDHSAGQDCHQGQQPGWKRPHRLLHPTGQIHRTRGETRTVHNRHTDQAQKDTFNYDSTSEILKDLPVCLDVICQSACLSLILFLSVTYTNITAVIPVIIFKLFKDLTVWDFVPWFLKVLPSTHLASVCCMFAFRTITHTVWKSFRCILRMFPKILKFCIPLKVNAIAATCWGWSVVFLVQRHFDFPVVEDPQPNGAGRLIHSSTLQNYLSLLATSQREETQEACCGALQNLTAHDGIVRKNMIYICAVVAHGGYFG